MELRFIEMVCAGAATVVLFFLAPKLAFQITYLFSRLTMEYLE